MTNNAETLGKWESDRMRDEFPIGAGNPPTPLHPMYVHTHTNRSWLIGSIAREALFTHVNGNSALVNELRTFIAGLTQSSLYSVEQWKGWINTMIARHGGVVVNLLMNAAQNWMINAFEDINDFYKVTKNVVEFYRLQFATSVIIPDEYKGPWDENKHLEFFSSNPVAALLLAVHLGGPIRDYEAKRMLKRTEVVDDE